MRSGPASRSLHAVRSKDPPAKKTETIIEDLYRSSNADHGGRGNSKVNSPPSPQPSAPGVLTPSRIASIYLVAAFAWFLITDEVIGHVFAIPIDLLILRGAMFIAVTALFLYFLVTRYRNDLNRSNAELEESTARANTYFESAVEGIIGVDENGRILRANATIERLFGYSPAELIGKPMETLVPERLRRLHERHRDKYFQEPRSRPMGLGLDLVGKRKDGSEFPIEVSLSFVQTDNGRLVIAFVTDITERLALEREARRGQTLATLGMVAAGIVHEINNPIGIISSRAELLLADADSRGLSPELKADLEVLHRNALRVGRISQGLLTLARQEPKHFAAIDINNVVEDALLLVSKQMNKDGIRIETALDPSLPRVSGDSTALEEVIINLLLNAKEAMAGAGVIRVETEYAHESNDRVSIVVIDHGPGIPMDEVQRLFDPFFSTKTTGLGIGLWLSKRIIREHRGEIAVESAMGKGTRFLIHLPTGESQPQ